MQSSIAITAILWAATSYILYTVVSSFISSRRNAARARQLGCEEPLFEVNRWPLGIDNALRTITAVEAQRFPVDMVQRFDEVGAYTHCYRILGSKYVRTADPKNIQAILANQFSDFDLGPKRLGAFFPLLGSGIFTVDGEHWKYSRALIRPQFTREQVSDLDLEETHVKNMMNVLETSIGASGWIYQVDLLPYFFRLTMDSSTEFVFGESVNSQLSLLSATEEAQ